MVNESRPSTQSPKERKAWLSNIQTFDLVLSCLQVAVGDLPEGRFGTVVMVRQK